MPTTPKKPRRQTKPDAERRTVPFMLRLTIEERGLLEAIADQENVSVAWLIRQGIEKIAEEYSSKLND